MIKKLKLFENFDVKFSLFSVISHEKSYKLCWRINKQLNINLIRAEDLKIAKAGSFLRYEFVSENERIELFSNRAVTGYLDAKEKNVSYFLKVEKPFFDKEKTNFINKLKGVSEILLIFEVDLEKDINKKEIFYD